MSTIPEKCASQVPAMMEVTYYWVLVREWKRVREGTAAMNAWDNAVKELLDSSKGDQDKFRAGRDKLKSMISSLCQSFTDQVDDAIASSPISGMPGYDAQNCKFNWGVFACMVNYMATVDDKVRAQALDAYSSQGAQVWSCDIPTIQNDPAYSGQAPTIPHHLNWKPWAIGGAAIIGAATAGIFLIKRIF